MKKLTIALCFILMPALFWGAPKAPVKKVIEKTKVVVAMTGIRSKSLQSIKTNIYDEAIYTSLMKIKGISVIPQKTMEIFDLNIEENNSVSIKNAVGILKADKIICCFAEQINSDYTIAFYIFDGNSGEQIYFKVYKAKDSISFLKIIRNCITEAESTLIQPKNLKAVEKNITKSEATKETTKIELIPVEEKQSISSEPTQQINIQTKINRLNIELSLYDFVNNGLNPDLNNTFLFAVNYEMFIPLKNLTLSAGPFYSQMKGNNNIGLRINGYYYPFSSNSINIFFSISGEGGLSLTNSAKTISCEAKIGAEITFGTVELFGEGGVCLRKGSTNLNILINSGIKVYIF
ncbi:MAG: hypothetical protein A2452_00255 [Candidatus Firestonebacteria bacterium RIFOXYC2_FULL_39_67]|nr:MAG: hypothetical protein A2536_05960 [Candidatus Firestonebacteria bacterium RIFOXYD2_FULL_39_29]OGF54235.1 MAG: hypothetical protein A2452_00255 [Candidatus Firestonebacteria bacterium RIFOXYC2_FULL_39_67]OGF56096.1 MAG: hypothetical protein A2497_01640 [Candidatus Firestonebacteria bacterium RifOxyC12_full_39_7]